MNTIHLKWVGSILKTCNKIFYNVQLKLVYSKKSHQYNFLLRSTYFESECYYVLLHYKTLSKLCYPDYIFKFFVFNFNIFFPFRYILILCSSMNNSGIKNNHCVDILTSHKYHLSIYPYIV